MREKLFFRDSAGTKLCGILSSPGNSVDLPVIILCHGFSTSKDNSTNRNLEKILNENGIATFRFDFFAHGESEGKFEEITISKGADGILSAIKFLKGKGYQRIGLMGSSFGGISSLMAASKSSDLYVLALKAPVSNYFERDFEIMGEKELEEWKNKGHRYYCNNEGKKLRVNYSFLEDYANNNGYEAAKRIAIPTLIVHGNLDRDVPLKQSVKTAGIIKNCRLKIIEGADHKFTKPEDFRKMLELISGFIVEHAKMEG